MNAREEWLQRLLVGEVDPESEDARRFFAEHAGARAELESMRRLEEAIRRAGHERGEVVGGALEGHGNGAEAERFVAERLARGPARRGPLGSLSWALPLAAAAALALFLWAPWSAPDGPPAGGVRGLDPGPMMGGELRLLPPLRSGDAIAGLRWEYELEGAQYFKVFVYDPARPLDPLAESPELEENRWNLDPAAVARWPDPFEWQVHVMGDAGTELVESSQARRSP